MNGLSAQEITNLLSMKAATPATRSVMLNFLNDAGSPAAIAGIEPETGPIVDDPGHGKGDQIADYDIGLKVAERIIARRTALGGFTDLTQLHGIKGFGADKFVDMVTSLAFSVHEVSGIIFNWNNLSNAHDGLNIRKNFSTAAPSPAWHKGSSLTFTDSTAAYAIKETRKQALAIRVSFKANGISGAFVRAIGGGRLGTVREQFVSFDEAGASGWETFQILNPSFHDHGVNIHDVVWRWQWRRQATDPWRSLTTTRHRIYVVLSAPTLPWVQTPGSSAQPWTDALEIACRWAAGATDQVSAATRVTQGYNACGRVAYDTTNGATFYGFTNFNLTQMIARLNGQVGLGGKVNCTDSANTVSTFANLIGCDLWQSRMGWSFALNPMIAIGYNTWAVPFNGAFSYHEVAWTAGCTANDRVFDGCLKVDGDANPTTAPHTALLPVDMLFGDCSAMNYRLRLSPPTPNGCARCEPQPGTSRQRRAII